MQEMFKVDRSDHLHTIFTRTLYISQCVCNIISSQLEIHRNVHVPFKKILKIKECREIKAHCPTI